MRHQALEETTQHAAQRGPSASAGSSERRISEPTSSVGQLFELSVRFCSTQQGERSESRALPLRQRTTVEAALPVGMPLDYTKLSKNTLAIARLS